MEILKMGMENNVSQVAGLGWVRCICVCLYLVALFPLAVPVGVREVYVTACLFHNSFDVIPSFPNNM